MVNVRLARIAVGVVIAERTNDYVYVAITVHIACRGNAPAKVVTHCLTHGTPDAGQTTAALQVFKQLAVDHPRSGNIQETYAKLLSRVADPQHRQQALLQWRRVVQHSPPKSARWYRAKYQIAETYFLLGKRQEAAARIRYLQATSGLQDSGMQAEFEALLKRCQP